jgi:hypothetical protein
LVVYPVDGEYIDMHSVACNEELVFESSTFGREMELAVSAKVSEVGWDMITTCT